MFPSDDEYGRNKLPNTANWNSTSFYQLWRQFYGVYFDRTFSEPQGKGNTYPLAQTEIEYYLTENLEGFRIKAKIDNEGELSISEANKGEFVDLNEYDENTLSPIEPKYVELFDKVVEMVTESTYFNAKDDERLKAMSDSDKSHLVGTLVMQSYEGNENVDTIKSNWWARIAILVVLGLYDWLIIYLKNEQYVFESRILSDRNGELIASGSTSDISLINLGLKYKEAFMDAEERRIKRIHKLLEENFEEGTVDKILTNYEKRLVLKQV